MKRLYTGKELEDLKDSLDPDKIKAKEKQEAEKAEKEKAEATESSKGSASASPSAKVKDDKSSPSIFQEPKSVAEMSELSKQSSTTKTSPDSKSIESTMSKDSNLTSPSDTKLLSPIVQSKPDSSSTPRSESSKTDTGSPTTVNFSPVSKPDSQVQNSPDIQIESVRSNNSWNLGQFKTTPTHKSEASPLNRTESQCKLKHSKVTEQCSPTTSLEHKLSPDAVPNVRQDLKTPNSWNYGNYSPMPRQDSQFSSQRSPYSTQPSPAQPSPYSAQPSPYSTQPSPYSSQPSPYSAQPSPDTSQIVKQDLQKSSGAWNAGSYSPITKPPAPAPFSPHPGAAARASPDASMAGKSDALRGGAGKAAGQYSPMSRQERIHQSPYSPRPSVDHMAHANKKSSGVGGYGEVMRTECQVTSPEAVARQVAGEGAWGLERFGGLGAGAAAASIESLLWGAQYLPEPPPPRADCLPALLSTPPPHQPWPALPSFEPPARRHAAPAPAASPDDLADPWSLGQFRVEPPHDAFGSNVNFDALAAHLTHQQHIQNFIDENFSETSRVD